MVSIFEQTKNSELEKFKVRQKGKVAELMEGKERLNFNDIQNGLRDSVLAASNLLSAFTEALMKDRHSMFAEEMAELSHIQKNQTELDVLTREKELKEEIYLKLKETFSEMESKME